MVERLNPHASMSVPKGHPLLRQGLALCALARPRLRQRKGIPPRGFCPGLSQWDGWLQLLSHPSDCAIRQKARSSPSPKGAAPVAATSATCKSLCAAATTRANPGGRFRSLPATAPCRRTIPCLSSTRSTRAIPMAAFFCSTTPATFPKTISALAKELATSGIAPAWMTASPGTVRWRSPPASSRPPGASTPSAPATVCC